jgi:phosphoglycolate phosphatase
MEQILLDRSDDFRAKVVTRYREMYDAQILDLCPPFPELDLVLKALKDAGVTLTIASSKRKIAIDRILAHYNLSDYFALVVGSSEVTQHKPHPESVHMITDKLSIDGNCTVVVGDTTYDLEMAQKAGVDAIGVITGTHTKKMLESFKPLKIVSSLGEIVPIILNGKMNSIIK